MRLFSLCLYRFYFVALCLSVSSVYAQDSKSDSLKLLINQKNQLNEIDSILYTHTMKLASYYYRLDQDSSLLYMLKALEIASTLGYDYEIGRCAYNASVMYKRQGEMDKAMANVQICIKANPGPKMKARCLQMCGNLWSGQYEFEKAKGYLDQAMQIGQDNQDTTILSMLYNSYAIYYEFTHDYESSIDAHLKSADISLSEGDSIGYAVSLNNIAILHNSMKEYDKALEYTIESEKYIEPENLYNRYQVEDNKGAIYTGKGQSRKALEYYNKAYDNAVAIKAQGLQVTTLLNMSRMHIDLDEFDKANKYLTRGLSIKEIQPAMMVKYHIYLSEIALRQGRCRAALDLLKQVEQEISKEPEYVYQSSYYKNVSRAEACLGNYKAFDANLLKSFALVDSSYKETRSREAKVLLHKYESKIKQDSIRLLSLENENQDYIINGQRKGLLISLLVLMLSAALIYILRKRNQEAKIRNDALVFKTEELTLLNTQLKKKLNKPAGTKDRHKIEIKCIDKQYLIEFDDIIYLIAEDNGTRIYLTDKSIWSDLKLKSVSELLPADNFLKIYRSTIINIDKLEWVNHATLKMVTGEELKIGRTYKSDIKELLSER